MTPKGHFEINWPLFGPEGQDEQGKVNWIVIPNDVTREISDFWFPRIPDLKKDGPLAFAALGSNSDAFGPEGQDDQGKVSWIVIPYPNLNGWICMKMHS